MPIYRAFDVKAITFFRADTRETCQFNLVVASSFSVERKPLTQVIQAGKKISVLEQVTLKVSVLDNGLVAMLQSWEDNFAKVQAVAAANPNLQWYNDSYISIKRTTQQEDGLLKYDIEMVATEIPSQRKIHMNENLLAYLGWADANSNGVADGYQTNQLAASSFVAGIQTLSPYDTFFVMGCDVIFPVTGLEFALSINYSSLFSGSPTVSTRIRIKNTGFAEIASPSTTYSLGGIRTAKGKGNSDVYLLACELVQINTPPLVTGSFKFPALTTNGKSTPGDKFMSW